MKRVIVRKNGWLSLALAFLILNLSACSSDDDNEIADDGLVWNDKSASVSMPDGARYMVGSIGSNNALYYIEVDLTRDNLALRAVKSDVSQSVANYVLPDGVIAAINGGFFSGNTSYSALIDNHQYFARNITSLNRGGESFPVLRSGFMLSDENVASVNWVYQFDTSQVVHVYHEPLPYGASDTTPLATPLLEGGVETSPRLLIGGGPTLVKNGQKQLTYDEEIFWGSGVELSDYRPRTAICSTADNKVIMLVAENYKLSTLPDLLIELGCDNGMNLDGGGSTAMSIKGHSVFNQGRAVPTALLLVERDLYQVNN